MISLILIFYKLRYVTTFSNYWKNNKYSLMNEDAIIYAVPITPIYSSSTQVLIT